MPHVAVNDAKFYVVDEGRGPPVLLVHGFPLDHSLWHGQIAALAKRQRVIAPDLRGFGRSEATPGTVTMEQFADDLAALLDALGVAAPATFCGLSMGGYIGWQFFLRHRRRLTKLIQCDTRAVADTAEARRVRLQDADDVEQNGPAKLAAKMLPKLFPPPAISEEQRYVTATREVMLGTAPAGIAAALRGMAARPDVTALLGQIDVPTLIVCGEHDALATPAEMRGIAERIPGASFVEIAGAGHMAPLESPGAFNAAAAAFLAR